MVIKYLPVLFLLISIAVSVPVPTNEVARGFILDLFGGMIGQRRSTTTTTPAPTTVETTGASGGIFGFGFGK